MNKDADIFDCSQSNIRIPGKTRKSKNRIFRYQFDINNKSHVSLENSLLTGEVVHFQELLNGDKKYLSGKVVEISQEYIEGKLFITVKIKLSDDSIDKP